MDFIPEVEYVPHINGLVITRTATKYMSLSLRLGTLVALSLLWPTRLVSNVPQDRYSHSG